MNELIGNLVTPNATGYGRLAWDGATITAAEVDGPCNPEADWILPGFIDLHLHGLGPCATEGNVAGMAEYAVTKGTTTLCPAMASLEREVMCAFLKTVRDLTRQSAGAKFAGSHLEGPWLCHEYKGGMNPAMLRLPTIEEADAFLDAAQGTLRLVTVAPELPGALEVVRHLVRHGVRVSCGHSALPPAQYEEAVEAGVTQFCHLFDAYACPTAPEGVRQPAITDLALIDDRVFKEIIMDGMHVPPELVVLARRAAGADHIIAITDALQGAGLPYGRFLDVGNWYVVRDGELGRRESDGAIVGSSLTQNRAFFNMTTRFGFTPAEASLALSANPARSLQIGHLTGRLVPGLAADIAVLAPDRLTVHACYVEGERKG